MKREDRGIKKPLKRLDPYRCPYGLAETCVFGKQSPGPAPAALSRFRREAGHRSGHPFSRSYGVILPNSLTRVLSNTLGYLPLPTSGGFGTGTCGASTEAFLASIGTADSR